MSQARTPRRIFEQAGSIPSAFVAAVATTALSVGALAQPGGDSVRVSSPDKPITGGQPAVVRDPMKPGQPKEGDKAKVRVSDQMTVDLHVKDENISNVLELLAIQSQKNIIASKNVSGKISADLYNVTFDEALDAILHVNGFGWIQQGNFIYVYTAEELEKIRKALSKRAAKVMRLNYLNAVDAAEFVKPMLSTGGEIKTSNKTENFSIPDSSPTGKDDYALGATIVVIDFEENIAAIEKLLVELDTKPAQVLVEATVMQTKLTEKNAFGVDFSIIGDLKFNEFAGALGGPLGIANAIRSGGGASPPASLADNRGVGVVSTPGKTDGASTLKIGVIADNVQVVAKFLDEVGDTAVLANPKLLTLNRQPARVLVGQRLGYLSSTATETSTTQTVQFLDTGVQLYFRPFVSAGGD
ncbi:MAG: secretin and TonB N-terminal domain-containing protein, partial [Phycisphaeraceae bacterium]|nr:secretin and TonB N-terminal domain-containing protein [Phycisphaeraceae bacterium]